MSDTARIVRCTMAVTLMLALIAAACGGEDADVAAGPSTSSPGQPNFVVIMTDDQTMEQMRVLPGVQELIGAAGITFTNSYTYFPTCCPSRATFLSGQHATNHGVLWNSPPTGGFQAFNDQETALPASLQQAGYQTAFVGKYLNGYGFRPEDRFVPPGWDDFAALVAPSETLYYNYTINDNGELVTYGSAEADYVEDVLAERATDSLAAMAEGDKPFFLYYAPIAPHGRAGARVGDPNAREEIADQLDLSQRPFLKGPVPAPRHVGAFDDEPPPSNPAIDETDVADKPRINRRAPLKDVDRDEIVSNYRLELESLLAVDDAVQAIFAVLEENELLDETYVVFTSDNGFFHGEHQLIGFKYLPYEPGLRVPLLIRGPGIPPGTIQHSLVSNVDLAPTIMDLAAAEPLREPDGRSLRPLLFDAEATWGRAIFIEGHTPRSNFRSGYRGVHTGDAVYIEYETGALEYYDLVADPWQLDNQILNPAHAEEIADLATLLLELEGCVGAACRRVGEDLSVPEDGRVRDTFVP